MEEEADVIIANAESYDSPDYLKISNQKYNKKKLGNLPGRKHFVGKAWGIS